MSKDEAQGDRNSRAGASLRDIHHIQTSKFNSILSDPSDYEVATFAGGCFWCMEAAFEATDGVIEAVSGYTGGHTVNPTYEQVLTKTTGHLEKQLHYNLYPRQDRETISSA